MSLNILLFFFDVTPQILQNATILLGGVQKCKIVHYIIYSYEPQILFGTSHDTSHYEGKVKMKDKVLQTAELSCGWL